MLTHRNIATNISQAEVMITLGQDERIIAILPFFHIYGLSVLMIPGWTTATRMPRLFTSWATASLIASRANFAAAYGPRGDIEKRPATEEMVTMQPLPLARIPGSTACMQRIAPK